MQQLERDKIVGDDVYDSERQQQPDSENDENEFDFYFAESDEDVTSFIPANISGESDSEYSEDEEEIEWKKKLTQLRNVAESVQNPLGASMMYKYLSQQSQSINSDKNSNNEIVTNMDLPVVFERSKEENRLFGQSLPIPIEDDKVNEDTILIEEEDIVGTSDVSQLNSASNKSPVNWKTQALLSGILIKQKVSDTSDIETSRNNTNVDHLVTLYGSMAGDIYMK